MNKNHEDSQNLKLLLNDSIVPNQKSLRPQMQLKDTPMISINTLISPYHAKHVEINLHPKTISRTTTARYTPLEIRPVFIFVFYFIGTAVFFFFVPVLFFHEFMMLNGPGVGSSTLTFLLEPITIRSACYGLPLRQGTDIASHFCIPSTMENATHQTFEDSCELFNRSDYSCDKSYKFFGSKESYYRTTDLDEASGSGSDVLDEGHQNTDDSTSGNEDPDMDYEDTFALDPSVQDNTPYFYTPNYAQMLKIPQHIRRGEDMWFRDVMEEHALLFLPTKSVCRFKAISKEWCVHISCPIFPYEQSVSFHPTSGYFNKYLHFHQFILLNAYRVSSPTPTFLPEPVAVRSSCNGLLLCQGTKGEYYVCNPITTELDVLPQLKLYHGELPRALFTFHLSEDGNFEMCYECVDPLMEVWKLIYAGSANDEGYAQLLVDVLVAPVNLGIYRFLVQAIAPDPSIILNKDKLGETVILLSCSYVGQEFVRAVYYVENEYDDENLRKQLPQRALIERVQRTTLSERPKITKYQINFHPENAENGEQADPEANDKEQQAGSKANAHKPTILRENDKLGATVILLSCITWAQNLCESDRTSTMSDDEILRTRVLIEKVQRTILSERPKVTKYHINFHPGIPKMENKQPLKQMKKNKQTLRILEKISFG